MNQNQTEKLVLERQAAELFADCFAKQFGRKFRFVSHNAPQKPDVTCKLDNSFIDFEIAHLYGSQAEARHILGKSLDPKTLQELFALEQHGDADERLVTALNRILDNKSTKQYDSHHVWLVIRNANPLWSKENVLTNVNKICVPQKHPFEQIWLIADFEGKTGLIPLLANPHGCINETNPS
ncbi:hypothetical protein [Thalassotalea aquiviva]|uniref:hypothetical protein n=1 Tax=Thalassotalea aquiviva TaxID=3242415 RepID=UPI00352BB8C2